MNMLITHHVHQRSSSLITEFLANCGTCISACRDFREVEMNTQDRWIHFTEYITPVAAIFLFRFLPFGSVSSLIL